MKAKSIILESCGDYGITREEFFDRRTKRSDVVACRVYAIARLRAAGFNNAGVARMIGAHYDTVRYWIKPELRANKIRGMHRWLEIHRAAA